MHHINEQNESMWKRLLFGKNIKTTLLRSFFIVLISVIVFRWVLIPVKNQTDSMSPNFSKGEIVWISPLVYAWKNHEVGDPVAIRLAGQQVVHLSRIIALPGQVVTLVNNQIYVDGIPLPGAILELPDQIFQTGYESEPVEEDEVFVMGDLRDRSIQELHFQGSFGRIKKSRILGKILF